MQPAGSGRPGLHIVAGPRLLLTSKLRQRNQRKNDQQGGNSGLCCEKKISGKWQEKTSEEGAKGRVGEANRGNEEAKMTMGENKKKERCTRTMHGEFR